ncbi:MAG: helix-turn-helix domain containing protein, partial [Elusimicrobiales bacterium]|nr:helix-turn-helix domain containing protein [Elusimicrobiales bacterium]
MPKTSPARRLARRDVILSAARRVLVKSSFSDVTLDSIAEEAGVAKGTLFLYFAGKEELFFAVFLGLLADLGGRLDALSASGLPPKELLRAAAVTLISHLERNRDFIERFRAGQFADSRAH